MSRNAKNARLTRARKAMAAVRKRGGKGPAQTEAKHGKRRANRNRFNVLPRPVQPPRGVLRGTAAD